MLIDKPLVLNKNVSFQGIETLNEKLNEKLGGNDNDFIISIKNSRVHSKRISNDSKSFIDQFEKPKLFVNVVHKYANEYQLDSEELLSHTYPMIKSFVTNGFLEYHTEEKVIENQRDKLFSDSTKFHQYEIISCVQFLDDTEAYQAKDKNGNFVLLKCIRTHTDTSKNILNTELSILKKLSKESNFHTPKYIECISKGDYTILVIEWIDGVSLWNIINDQTLKIDVRKKIALKILDAYNYIQQHRVLHADIHPNNIKVINLDSIKVFDFGSSIDLDLGVKESYFRAGIIRYYEPELASALLHENKRIVATEFSEQFQVATLIYQTLTGNHYLDLSYETDTTLEQITTSTPRTFSQFNLKAKRVESILNKALQKSPEKRYKKWSSFYKSLKIALQEPIEILKHAEETNYQNHGFDNFINEFVKEYGYDSQKLNEFEVNKPSCSFFHGATGIAYSFYRLSQIKRNPEFLSLADLWITLAERNVRSENAFVNEAVGMTKEKAGKNSYFHRATGIYAIKSLIKSSLGYSWASNQAIRSFIKELNENLSFSKDPYRLDPSQGFASYLFGLNMLLSLRKINKGNIFNDLNELTKSIVNTLCTLIKKSIDSLSPEDDQYLGFAHGYSGIIYALLQVDPEITRPHEKTLRELLQRIENYGTIDEEFAYWTVSTNKSISAVWTGWCHGTAGYILLWATAYKRFGDRKFLSLSTKAGNYLLKTYGGSNNSICCGLAGQSLAFYKLGQVTKDNKWFHVGRQLSNEAIKVVREYTLEDSLFQGKTGLFLVAGESINPENAVFPLCENPLLNYETTL